MKLSNVWNVLRTKDTGDLDFEDLVDAVTETVGVQDDMPVIRCSRLNMRRRRI